MTAPLRHAAFRSLVVGRTVAMAGNALAPIALAFAVLDLTGSATDLGRVGGARSLANVLLLLLGGVLADRLPRRLILVVSSGLAMLTQAAVAVLILTGTATLTLLIGLSAVNGAVAAFAFPATSALLPQTVPAELRQAANALNRLATNVAMIGGAALGGVLVTGLGPGWGIAIDAAAFGIAGILFASVRVPSYRGVDTGARRSLLSELRDGWAEVASRSWLWAVVVGCCFFNAAQVGALHVVGPVMADQSIGRTAWGFVLAAQTAGMVAGALVAMRLRARRLLLVGVCCCVGGVGWLLALALYPVLAVLLVAAFLTGVAVEQFDVAWNVSIQEHIPPDRLARVYSFDAVGSFLAIPAGQLAAGPAAAAFGPRVTLLGAAVVVLLAVGGMVLSRGVRSLEHTVAAPESVTV